MAVYVVQGGLGDGKSYWCCRMMIYHLFKGGIVATNMRLDPERIKRNTGRTLSKRQFLRVSATSNPMEIPRGDFRGTGTRRVVVVLDEALNWFASSTGAKDERKNTWGEWLRQSDKLGQDVYFVAQSFERSAKWIRELAAVVVSVMNMKRISVLGMPVGKWLRLGSIACAASRDARNGQVMGFDWFILRPQVWDCYATAELFGFDASANAYDGAFILPAFKMPVAAFLIPGPFFVWGLLRYASASWSA